MKGLTSSILLLAFFITSCTGLKYVPEGERLYTGAKVKMESTEKISSKKALINAAKNVIRPKPNKSILGMRPKLWFYYIGNDSTKGLRGWIRRKLGEWPVYFSEVTPSQTARYIDAAMFNRGVFRSTTVYDSKELKKTASVTYVIRAHPPFTIGTVIWPKDSMILNTSVTKLSGGSLLKQNAEYSLELLVKERQRIDETLKNQGFYFFRPDYILFYADTDELTRKINLRIGFTEEMPDYARRIYKIGRVIVDRSYTLNGVRNDTLAQTDIVDGIVFTGRRRIREKVIERSVFLKEREIYTRRNHLITLSRLTGMNTFQFVTVTLDTVAAPDTLDVLIRLTNAHKRTARVELQAVSKSNDFSGPGLNISYRNRNTFNGAEQLTLSLLSRYEWQIGGGRNIYSFDVRPQIELSIPRFIVPFYIKQPKSFYIPQTRFILGYEYLQRAQYYNLISFDFTYGYKWKENIKTDHELNPVFINYTSVRNKSLAFDSLLLTNPLLQNSFLEQFIAGINYTYTFDEQVIPKQRSQFYMQLKPETAGNLLQVVTGGNRVVAIGEGKKIAGSVFAQYFRFSAELRNYFNFTANRRFVARFFGGIGLPYGNSIALPYSKQFYSGGPNSVRAFRLNSLGPGIFRQEDPVTGQVFFAQGGELKLETNAEYRFGIYKIIKGAVFTDAGNIWLVNSNPSVPVPNFAIQRILPQLAVGSGIGIRLDVTFFVLRLDLATPLRKPWLPEGQRWVINDIRLGSSSWRKDNLILNIAIGYPF